jgi:hypothetical protein
MNEPARDVADAGRRIIIGVIGAGVCDTKTTAQAERLGELLAKRGAVIACGGLGGVMEAVSCGASRAGGVVVGILPGSDKSSANRYVTISVATGMGHARNVIIAQTADALVAVEGEYGTLSEIAVGLKLGKPVVAMGRWNRMDGVTPADSPEDAVEKVFSILNY